MVNWFSFVLVLALVGFTGYLAYTLIRDVRRSIKARRDKINKKE